ncbi:MAG: WbuC family cupin fold metalloprotein [Pseudomonadales bacterium]|nr:WbuC family cupin fold metalloprotein [Pseudomonadales bacterium]
MSNSIRLLDDAAIRELSRGAIESPRKRNHQLWHQSHQESVQRIAMWLEPETYVRPHLHPQDYKWEMMILLQGAARLISFDDTAEVTQVVELSPQGVMMVEMPPLTWHTFVVLEPTLLVEVKPGPFEAAQPEDFAQWAPMEGEPQCADYIEHWRGVSCGDSGAL